jgi:proline racemase/trans-L-3-hydroxyproline dehydratase
MAQFKRIITTVDSHTAGEPTRLVVGGLPSLPGATMVEKLAYARDKLDDLRGLLLLEPRGRQDMYGAILTSPSDPAADFGLIFMNTQRYTTMCGHAVIGAATTLVETGMVEVNEPETIVTFDTPAGIVHAQIHIEKGRVREVSFDSTPVFVYQIDSHLTVQGIGEITADIVYSGGFFAMVAAQQTGLELIPTNVEPLIKLGMYILNALNSQVSVKHPELPSSNLIEAVEFFNPVVRQLDKGLYTRNTVILGNRSIDRSPCGTGTCARMALLYTSGELKIGDKLHNESIIGTSFIGQIMNVTYVGEYPAILPRVTGRAHLTGLHQFVLDPEDPFQKGFSLTDFQID